MRLKQYILNEGRSRIINQEECISLLEKNCKESLRAFLSGRMIFRGVKYGDEYLYIDPKSGKPRISANTSNIYTLIMDNSKKWSKFPKRSRSIICTNNAEATLSYGDCYSVFPYDNAKIGICPESDLWFSFFNTFDNMMLKSFNGSVIELITLIDSKADYYNIDKDYKTLLKYLKKVEDFVNKNDKVSTKLRALGLRSFIYNEFSDYFKNKGSFIKYLESKLDPKKNNFKVTTDIYKIPTAYEQSHELWTDSKSIMVYYDQFMEPRKFISSIGVKL